VAANELCSAEKNVFDVAERKRLRDIGPHLSVQNKQYANPFRVNPPGSVPNTTVISYRYECFIAGVNRVALIAPPGEHLPV
jgi:hypothetical protein